MSSHIGTKRRNVAKALEQVKVLDFTRAFAGPLCTELLSQLGAEVIKIEIPDNGDSVRQTRPWTKGGESYICVILNRGKKSISLNLSSPKGRQIALDLAKQVDVVVENFSPGTMEKLGLGYEDIKKVNPGIVYASLSGFGHTGPRHAEPALDSITQAASGLMCVTGFPDRPPLKVGIAISDFLAGNFTAMSILAALRYKDRTGEGQAIDISMQDCTWSLTAIEFSPDYFLTGKLPERTGNAITTAVPCNNYRTKDGYVRISAGFFGQWQTIATAMGKEELGRLEQYSSVAGRWQHLEEIDAIVEKWTETLTTDQVLDICRRNDLPCTRIPTFDQVANDPQLLSRDMVVEVEQVISGKLKVPGTVFKMSKTPGDATSPAPFLGQHNYEVYSSMLGYNEEQIRKLDDECVI